MTRPSDICIAALAGAATVWLATGLCECECEADDTPQVAVAVARLQPRLSAEAARRWGEAIAHAASPHGLDPVLVAALVMRESSYDPRVADGRTRGARGELGVMQVMPGGAAMQWAPTRCSQTEAWCSLATGCGYLAHQRDHACPGSTWRWVAAYGRSRCPTEAEARSDHATVRAHRLYRRAGGTAWR